MDVVVRDKSGAVVRGLTAADFEVTEDGKPQEIRSFSFEEITAKPRRGSRSAELLDGAKRSWPNDSAETPALPRPPRPRAGRRRRRR